MLPSGVQVYGRFVIHCRVKLHARRCCVWGSQLLTSPTALQTSPPTVHRLATTHSSRRAVSFTAYVQHILSCEFMAENTQHSRLRRRCGCHRQTRRTHGQTRVKIYKGKKKSPEQPRTSVHVTTTGVTELAIVNTNTQIFIDSNVCSRI